MKRRSSILGINRRNLEFVFDDATPGRFRDLDDKLRGKERLEAAGVRVPRTLGVIRRPDDLDVLHEVLDTVDELVIKPVRGSGGKGIVVLARDGDAWRTPGGRRLDPAALEDHVLDVLSGSFSLDEAVDEVILEERIHPHDFLRELYPNGLSDLRIVVEDGEVVQAMLRVPTDASDGRANLHGGGLGLGIELDSGRIHHAVQGRRSVEVHPDTGVHVIGRTLPWWDDCLETARAAAGAFAEIRYLGVDIILDAARGPMVLEMNARPGLAIQIANREGQPVRRRVVRSPFERATEGAAWFVLAALLVLPIGFGIWQERIDTEVRAVRTDRDAQSIDESVDDEAGLEWSDEGIPLSTVDDRFALARTAASLGDTARALTLYREVAEDDALAPFAMNNIALIHRDGGDLERALSVLDRALDRFPDYARGAYNRGLILRDLGRVDAAAASFDRALELRPGYAAAWGERGEIALDRGNAEAARQAFERAVRFDPDAVADRWWWGRALLALDRPGEAAERFRECLALGGGTAATRDWVVARLDHADRRGLELAPATLDSLAAALRPEALEPGASNSIAALWGELLWRRGDTDAALQWYARPEIDGASIALLKGAVALDLERGRWASASQRLQRSDDPAFDRWRATLRLATAVDAGRDLESLTLAAAPLVDLARHRILRGDPTAAPDAPLEAADATERRWVLDATTSGAPSTPSRLRVRPDDAPLPIPAVILDWWSLRAGALDAPAFDAAYPDFAPRMRARFHVAVGNDDLEAAHALGMQLMAKDAAGTDVMLGLIGIEIERGRPALARSILQSLPPRERSRPDVRRLEARLLREEGEDRAARDVLEDLAAADPYDADLLAELARVQSVTGKRRTATETWRRALQERPERADWSVELARLLTDRRRYEEAVAAWDRALGLGLDEDEAVSAHFNRALSLQRQDLHDRAVAGWDSVLAREPDNRPAVYNRALALQELGRDDEAVAGYRRALALDPDHSPSRERLDALLRRGPE